VEGDFQVGRWLVQPKLNTISGNGKTVHLEPKAMQVLVYLAEHAGDVMAKERIIQAVWADTFVTDDVLTRSISELRKAFEDDPHEPRFIQTIPKGGYRLIAPVDVGAIHELPLPKTGLRAILESPLRKRWLFATAGGLLTVAIIALILNIGGSRDRLFRRAAPPAEKLRLVVLPFDNLSGDPEQEYFSDGITEEMTAQLARLHPERLAVIGRASAMTYKGRKKTIDEIGKELRVQYVLEGSVRRQGDRVRVTAQLVEVGDQTHVWAESYDRALRDILALQSEVAQAITDEIKIKLTPQEQTRLASTRPVNPEAYELYLRGKYYDERGGVSNAQKAQAHFQQAVEKDPQYAPAYAGMALAYPYFANVSGVPVKDAYARTRELALKALEIDPHLAETHLALAAYEFGWMWNWLAAQRAFEQAISLNPSYAEARASYAEFLSCMGRHNQALAEVKQAHELDPLSLYTNTQVGYTFYWARRPDEAMEQFKKTLDLDPSHGRAHIGLGRAYVYKGMVDEGIAEMEKGHASWGLQGGSLWGYALGAGGRREEAMKMLPRYLEVRKPLNPFGVATVYAGLGDKDKALVWLERTFDEHGWSLVRLKVDPFFDSLRSDPRFQDLLRRMNFPP
jgi:TolB-like protein/DNA-binding winged helix-turn-helix (wHTH) protein/Tfp pilus assembly protein PilF